MTFAISIERFLGICYPLKVYQTFRRNTEQDSMLLSRAQGLFKRQEVGALGEIGGSGATRVVRGDSGSDEAGETGGSE